MSFFSKTSRSQIYRTFRTIHAGEYRRIVRFYERHERDIEQLDFEEYFELFVTYSQALFEIGEYQKYLEIADTVIQTAIIQNITTIKGVDIYEDALFKKAASYFNLGKPIEAQYILEELILINPYEETASAFLSRILRAKKPQYMHYAQGTTILFFILSAIIVCVEVLVVRNLYKLYASSFESVRNGLFTMGILLLVSTELWHRWETNNYVRNFTEKAKRKWLLKQSEIECH